MDISMPELKLRKTGNSLSTSWPKEALARMNAKEGDTLYAVETPQGFLVTPFDPKFAKTMEAADRVFHRYKNAYRELSKK
jgi:putative addiction module antidote